MPHPSNIEVLVQKHSLHVKFDYQLAAMLSSHSEKLAHLRRRGGDLEKITQRPDAVRQEIIEADPDGLITDTEVDAELASRLVYYNWKDQILADIVNVIPLEQAARSNGDVVRNPIGTEFFIDSDNGNDGNDGLTTGAAFATLDQFTENARSAGDIATLRRGMTNRYDNGSDLAFTSDGEKSNPIIIRADNANAFSDDVDLSATATATLTFGSKTVTFSADISGVLAAGDWIYAASDDADEFSYEVDSVSTETVTLFLPYKGAQAGAGKTMTDMQSPPIWNTAAGDFEVTLNGDWNWKFQGIHFRGTDANGNVRIDSNTGHLFKDCMFEGNGVSDRGIVSLDDVAFIYVSKCRFFNHDETLLATAGLGAFRAVFRDCLFDGNSVAGSTVVNPDSVWDDITFIECEFKNHANADMAANHVRGASQYKLRNCLLLSTTEVKVDATATGGGQGVFIEDHDGSLGVLAEYNSFGSSGTSVAAIDSDTGTVRSGGGATSGKCTPSLRLGTKWELSWQLLFEIPFYATTTSKKYEVFFRPTATDDWTADPTADELWIELEYWGHASNNFRRITKSTGVIDMNGSTTFTALDVTIAPSQAGVAYLRGYYAKTKESGKANTFFWDIKPVVT